MPPAVDTETSEAKNAPANSGSGFDFELNKAVDSCLVYLILLVFFCPSAFVAITT